MKTAIACLLALTVSAAAQPVPYQFLVIYEVSSTSPKALVPSKLDRAGCEQEAADRSAKFLTDGYRVKCEVRGPHDMIWKLWGLDPEQVK